MLRRKNYAWTPDDDVKLREMAANGLYIRNIALKLKRSESSVKKHGYDLGLNLKTGPRLRADGTLIKRRDAEAAYGH